MTATSYSAARAVARAQASALIAATNRCAFAIGAINLDAYAKALTDASAYAFGVIQAKDCGVAEVASTQYNEAYASVMTRVEIYGMFTGVCTKCCGKP